VRARGGAFKRRFPRKIARTRKNGWRSTTGTDIRQLTSV
jgi:hypothetical protein